MMTQCITFSLSMIRGGVRCSVVMIPSKLAYLFYFAMLGIVFSYLYLEKPGVKTPRKAQTLNTYVYETAFTRILSIRVQRRPCGYGRISPAILEQFYIGFGSPC